jgi:hypothetical protein
VALGAGPASSEISIDHAPPGCALSGQPPRLLARFFPAAGVASARVLFRSYGATAWCAVPVKSEMPSFQAALPRPDRAAQRIEYFIEVTDKAGRVTRSPTHLMDVVREPEGCRRDGGLALVADRPGVADCRVAVREPDAATETSASRRAALSSTEGAASPRITAQTGSLHIEHHSVACVVDKGFPRLTADVSPRENLASLRTYFRTDPGRPWCSVGMRAPASGPFEAVLPRMGGAKKVMYYIEATDTNRTATRTEEYEAEVLEGTECTTAVARSAPPRETCPEAAR